MAEQVPERRRSARFNEPDGPLECLNGDHVTDAERPILATVDADQCLGRVNDPAAHDLARRSEEHTSELQSHVKLVCRLLLEKKKHIWKLPDQCKNTDFDELMVPDIRSS